MQINTTTSNLAVMGIRWGLIPDDMYLWMLGQSHWKLFSKASHSQEMSHRASVRWSTPPPEPPGTAWHTYTPLCQSVRNKWGEVGRMCSASRGDLSLHPLSIRAIILTAETEQWNCSDMYLSILYLSGYYYTDACFSCLRTLIAVILNHVHVKILLVKK